MATVKESQNCSYNSVVTLQKTIDLSFEKHLLPFKEKFNLPSFVLGLSSKGKTIWKKAYGFADLENLVPANVETHYRLASISKSFTSVLFGSLVERGLVMYDDPVSKYLSEDDFPVKFWNGQPVEITMRQLLSHTAGIRQSTEFDFDWAKMDENGPRYYDLLIKREPLIFEPGTAYRYSNDGYEVVSKVIEAILKKPFPEAMTEFLRQHKLDSTFVETRDLLIKNRARYYRYLDKNEVKGNAPTWVFDELIFAEHLWASGGMVSSVGDLMKFGNLLIDSYKNLPNAILSSNILKQIWTPQTAQMDIPMHPNDDYCLGFHKIHLDEANYPKAKYRNYYVHNGSLFGVLTSFIIFPDEEIVAVALTNKGELPDSMEKAIAQFVNDSTDFI